MLVPKSKYSAAQSLSRATLVLVVLWLAGRVPAYGQRRLVSVGDRRLSIDCEGDATKQTVVLLAGLGRTAEDWAKVQPAIAAFDRVCSYDRAGSGGSDKIAPPQNVAGIVEAQCLVEIRHHEVVFGRGGSQVQVSFRDSLATITNGRPRTSELCHFDG